jgi:hypothetical protein
LHSLRDQADECDVSWVQAITEYLIGEAHGWKLDRTLYGLRSRDRHKMKTKYRFSDLGREHQIEVIGNLGRKVAKGTVWELIPDFPVDQAAALAWDTGIQIFDDDVESLIEAIKHHGNVIRPILIDDLDDDNQWMEGRHRAISSQEMGLKRIPALYRVK